MSVTPVDVGEKIVERCRALGFAAVGVCSAEPSARASEFRAWLDRGEHGEMDFMAEAVEVRIEPARLLEGARSFVMVADLYASRGEGVPRRVDGASGRVARYVRGDDYHKLIKRRLHALCDALRPEHPGHRFRSFVDTAPVLERDLAVRCGMGWTAKNTMLIHPGLGSYIVLGGFATTLEIEPPASQERFRDHCGTCTRCIEACPTGAITPYHVDARRCISYLTIEHRGEIELSLHKPMGEWLYGCDICQEVCPHNAPTPFGVKSGAGMVGDAYAKGRSEFDLLEVLGWGPNERRGAFNSSAMKRATLEMMQRNAIIVMGNLASAERDPLRRSQLRDAVLNAMWDAKASELVRRTASVVLASIDNVLTTPDGGIEV